MPVPVPTRSSLLRWRRATGWLTGSGGSGLAAGVDIAVEIRLAPVDAVFNSVGANAEHGLRRTNADKRRAVLTLLNDDE